MEYLDFSISEGMSELYFKLTKRISGYVIVNIDIIFFVYNFLDIMHHSTLLYKYCYIYICTLWSILKFMKYGELHSWFITTT